MTRIFFATIFSVWTLGLGHADAPTIVVGSGAPAVEQIAARELQKYLYSAADALLPVANDATGDAIVLGTPTSNHIINRLGPAMVDLGNEGFIIRTVEDGDRKLLMVAGNTPWAVQCGVYSLLEEYGFGFYLGGDAVPTKKPFRLLDLDIVRKPAFKVRGTLPWYNFFNSPTAWDFEDYASFFDQLVKAKNNFVGFHVYDFEPFAAYEEGGKYVAGEPLAGTEVGTWGTSPMKTTEFGFETGRYFPTEYFGAEPALYRGDRERSIRDSQELLRKALDYSKSRGLKVCLGFEVSEADPTDPGAVERLEKRLAHLVAQYPMLDYVWIWEPEGRGVHGQSPPALDSDLGAAYRHYEQVFSYLNDPKRITEAVRLTLYAREADRILHEAAHHMRLVVSGWGGDHHLRCSDFHVGMDKLLPKDIIFAALDNIRVSDTVSAAYGQVSPERERWPIPWFEFDGDQWHPQPNARTWLNTCRDSLSKGSQGILGIHWRTRDVEESHALMSRFAWEPTLTYERFYADYAKRCFGEAYAAEMARILQELQSLGYRWIGGGGQQECGRFGWGSPTDPAKAQKLEAIGSRLRSICAELAGKPDYARQAERATYFLSTAEWVLGYERTAGALRQGGEVSALLEKARQAGDAGDGTTASKLALAGLAKLWDCDFGLALDACARRITNKGELGILATVNTKAWAAYRSVEAELLGLAGVAMEKGVVGKTPDHQPPTTNHEPSTINHEPLTISPLNPNALWFAGTPLPIKAVAHGDGCKAWVIYRKVGEEAAQSLELGKPAERYFEGSIDCPSDAPAGIEYAIELADESGERIARWPGPELMHHVTIIPPPILEGEAPAEPSDEPHAEPPISNLRIVPGEAGAVVLEWDGAVRRCEIRRSIGDGAFELLRTTSETWFEDRSAPPGQPVRYSVTSISRPAVGTALVSDAVEIIAPRPGPPQVTAVAGPRKVRLRWPKAPLGVSGYFVYESASAAGPWECVNGERPVPPDNWSGHSFAARAEPERPTCYRVVPLDRDGSEGASSETMLCAALPSDANEAVLAVDFGKPLPKGSWGIARSVESVNGVAVGRLAGGNYLVFPHRPQFSLEHELTIAMWVRLESPGVMPVLLCHGAWEQDGYFIQVLHGQVRFNLHGVGTLDAGSIAPGKWHHMAATYDGFEMAVYIDGVLAGKKQADGQIAPCARNLYIGRYEVDAPEYAVDCRIAEVKLLATALLPEEVKEEHSRLGL